MSQIQPIVHELPTIVLDAQAEAARREKLARKAGRFRILIVGRANAGKTTILKKICDTTDDPDIYNSKGRKVDPSKIVPTTKRGMHDITNELIFRSSPGFIFHDSRGFEAGGVDELQKVKTFLSERSREKNLKNQVHVIWYCIPMNDSRPITNAEIQFFSKLGTGKVPVIAVFTKCEILELTAIEILEGEKKLTYHDAVKGASEYAKKNLQTIHLDLAKHRYPPRGHVYLQDMEKPHTECKELAIFISTQQVSLEISVKYATKSLVKYSIQKPQDRRKWTMNIFQNILTYFPYGLVRCK
ncbi:hypothetical protein BDZ94DRAFT_1292467 [Collybia nuda]|uniref:G domain-containing protein n=1 Tax=Collybia nuda TaxID=64659 RepID=A0A9P5XXC1_9AGAR|nr:hypothetical protein BDZ94DRAFT_1292467 [Collybia nuda]